MRWATSGISNAPGTQATSTSSAATPWRTSPSRAPSRSIRVTSSLKRATTMPKRSPRPISSPCSSRPIPAPLPNLLFDRDGPQAALDVEQVPHPGSLRFEVLAVGVGRLRHDRHALDDLEAEAVDAGPLGRVVGQQADVPQAEVDQDLGADAVVAEVRREAQVHVGVDRVQVLLVLEAVGAELVHDADAA